MINWYKKIYAATTGSPNKFFSEIENLLTEKGIVLNQEQSDKLNDELNRLNPSNKSEALKYTREIINQNMNIYNLIAKQLNELLKPVDYSNFEQQMSSAQFPIRENNF